MERKKEASKNKGFYIAVCCCVLVIAIVGYVSRLTKNNEPAPQNHTDFSYTETYDVPNVSKVSKVSEAEEKEQSVPERKIIPIEEKPEPVAKNIITEDNTPVFSLPVDGKLTGKFSGEKLVFHEAVSDWRSHDGVDYKAEEGSAVVASADGVVESIYQDTMGNCIVIDHENGLKSVYANLAETDKKLLGKNVKRGEKIGEVGNTAVADFEKEAHLHFEILKDSNPVDPADYIE